MPRKVAIIGLGNEVLGDDRVGLEIAQQLRQSPNCTDAFDVLTDTRGGLSLAEKMLPYTTVILLDAIHTAGGVPGAIHTFSADEIPVTRRLGAMHDLDVPSALKLLQEMGSSVPRQIWVVAVQAAETERFSEQLTPAVQASVAKASEMARSLALSALPEAATH